MDVPDPVSLPTRILMGPGPSDVPPSVLAALGAPTVGHLDPAFLRVADQVRAMLRAVFGTGNGLTLPMSGTGSSGMETCFVNLLEPGDRVLVCKNGVFGTRMADVAPRCGAEVTLAEAPWGRAVDPDDVKRAAGGKAHKLLCVVHAETSTGVLQDLRPFRALADDMGALLLVDTVTSLGGVPVDVDALGMDAVYSGTQKCLSCPPGLSPVTFSDRARAVLDAREHAVQSWYLDLRMIARYWGEERVYHHTAPVNMIYALHEALRLVLAEGLEARHARHRIHAAALRAGLTAMGLTLPVPEAERLDPLTLVRIPDGADDATTRRLLLERYGLEIGGGLGDFKGNAWRIGLMGAACTRRNVVLCLTALADALRAQGVAPGADAVAAAGEVWAAAGDPSGAAS
jgi:alanine-glyoxylate transaminase / serine-glyoxylate transaminase / serine-pyruvate transaminase